jgi:hypothetical protein
MTEITPSAMPGGTPEELRDRAAARDAAAAESFERCDTDGFMSQWAHGVNAQKDRLAADIAENDGYHTFRALFDRGGKLVTARRVETRYGMRWAVKAPGDHGGPVVEWFKESEAKDWRRALKANAAKGYFVGLVMLPAQAVLRGANACTVAAYAVPRYDDDRDYVIVDNGSATVDSMVVRDRFLSTLSLREARSMPEADIEARVVNELLARAVLWGRPLTGPARTRMTVGSAPDHGERSPVRD